MRAFIAIEMPPPTLRQIVTVQRQLAQQLRNQQLDRCVRWTPASNLHLTLRFLGEIEQSQCDALLQMLPRLAARQQALSLSVKGMGCFPNVARPSVIWCGLQGDLRSLAMLQTEVERAAQSVGMPPDDKHFKPHLTIGRTQRNATATQLRSVGAIVMQNAALPVSPSSHDATPIGELLLFQSKLTPSGPIYTRLGVFPLAS